MTPGRWKDNRGTNGTENEASARSPWLGLPVFSCTELLSGLWALAPGPRRQLADLGRALRLCKPHFLHLAKAKAHTQGLRGHLSEITQPRAGPKADTQYGVVNSMDKPTQAIKGRPSLRKQRGEEFPGPPLEAETWPVAYDAKTKP